MARTSTMSSLKVQFDGSLVFSDFLSYLNDDNLSQLKNLTIINILGREKLCSMPVGGAVAPAAVAASGGAAPAAEEKKGQYQWVF